MPIALIEAQLAGIPVVATDVGSNSEVIVNTETGFVVSKSAQALADAISTLAAHPQLRTAMGCAAAERALRVFSPAQMIDSHATLYMALFRPAV
jgi:glycosyltransferase involved in cell wall biosynthesis